VSRDWRLFLDDVIERAEKIGRLVKSHTFESFCADESDFDLIQLEKDNVLHTKRANCCRKVLFQRSL